MTNTESQEDNGLETVAGWLNPDRQLFMAAHSRVCTRAAKTEGPSYGVANAARSRFSLVSIAKYRPN